MNVKNITVWSMVLFLSIFMIGCKSDDTTKETKVEKLQPTVSESNQAWDYRDVLYKTWVSAKWNSDEDYDSFSFYITYIGNGYVKGWLNKKDIVVPECQYQKFYKNPECVEFIGELDGQVAMCYFTDSKGKDKILRICFTNEMTMKADICDEGTESERTGLEDGDFFRQYNLADIKDMKITFSEETELIKAENKVRLMAGKREMDRCVVAYMTDADGNIICQFTGPFEQSSQIVGVLVEDTNYDQLPDIIWETCLGEESNCWVYVQMENGMFLGERNL